MPSLMGAKGCHVLHKPAPEIGRHPKSTQGCHDDDGNCPEGCRCWCVLATVPTMTHNPVQPVHLRLSSRQEGKYGFPKPMDSAWNNGGYTSRAKYHEHGLEKNRLPGKQTLLPTAIKDKFTGIAINRKHASLFPFNNHAGSQWNDDENHGKNRPCRNIVLCRIRYFFNFVVWRKNLTEFYGIFKDQSVFYVGKRLGHLVVKGAEDHLRFNFVIVLLQRAENGILEGFFNSRVKIDGDRICFNPTGYFQKDMWVQPESFPAFSNHWSAHWCDLFCNPRRITTPMM